jgi:cytochrome oxidase Cu insertion factor (SCO1/SenC/PrrC family)
MTEQGMAGVSDRQGAGAAQTDGHDKRLARGLLWGLLGMVLVVIIGLGVLGLPGQTSRYAAEDDLRPFGSVPEFTLQERSGKLVTKGDLLGKVWVTDFIFTRCVEECPLVSQRMARLQAAFATPADFRLVSITVDPEHDTPDVLSRYAANFGADAQRWLFLTGEKTAIYRLVQEGFHVGVVNPYEPRQSSAPLLPFRLHHHTWQVFTPAVAWAHHSIGHQDKERQTILHSLRFVLMDRQGQIRGYYDSNDEEALRRLQRHVKRLLQTE